MMDFAVRYAAFGGSGGDGYGTIFGWHPEREGALKEAVITGVAAIQTLSVTREYGSIVLCSHSIQNKPAPPGLAYEICTGCFQVYAKGGTDE